jgi:hypothetical protein
MDVFWNDPLLGGGGSLSPASDNLVVTLDINCQIATR